MRTPEEFLRDKGIAPTTIVAYVYTGDPDDRIDIDIEQLMREYAEYYDDAFDKGVIQQIKLQAQESIKTKKQKITMQALLRKFRAWDTEWKKYDNEKITKKPKSFDDFIDDVVKKYIVISKEQINKEPKKPEEELIPVPDDIVFKKLGGKIALVSPNGKLEMRREDGIEEENTWAARPSEYGKRIYPKGFKKVEYDKLQTGDFCTCVLNTTTPPLRIDHIELVVGRGHHKAWDRDEDIGTLHWDEEEMDDGDWYKVIF